MMEMKPDGFIGTVMAVEGISDSVTLLHGPDGCRKNLTILSSKSFPRYSGNRTMPGAGRVPGTAVVSTDYIYGAYGKLIESIDRVKNDSNLIAVVCTPGASLIGDDIPKAIEECGISDRAFAADASLISKPLNVGYDLTLVSVMEHFLPPVNKVEKGTVNLLGLSVLFKDWETVIEDMSDMLGLMGFRVISCPGAGSSLKDIQDSVNAEYNIVVCPEYASAQSEYYRSRYGIEAVIPRCSPVGFGAIYDFIRNIGEVTGHHTEKAIEYVDRYRKRAYRCLLGSRVGVRGASFAIDAEPSIVCPMVKWLFEDLQMVPVSVRFNGQSEPGAEESVREFLESKDLGQVLGAAIPDHVDYLLCDGHTATIYEHAGRCTKGIDISFPSQFRNDFMRSPVIGPNGVLFILDSLFNL